MRNQKELYPQKTELADISTWCDADIARAKSLWEREVKYSIPYQEALKREKEKSKD